MIPAAGCSKGPRRRDLGPVVGVVLLESGSCLLGALKRFAVNPSPSFLIAGFPKRSVCLGGSEFPDLERVGWPGGCWLFTQAAAKVFFI